MVLTFEKIRRERWFYTYTHGTVAMLEYLSAVPVLHSGRTQDIEATAIRLIALFRLEMNAKPDCAKLRSGVHVIDQAIKTRTMMNAKD